MKTCIPCLPEWQRFCPNCGEALDQVEYYTANAVSANSTRVDYNTVRTTTVYRNVHPHVGGFCRYCAAKEVAGKRKAGLILAFAGFVGGLAAMMYMVIKAANGGPSSGPELLLMLGGFFAGISGISIFAGSNMKQGIPLPQPVLYMKFIAQLKKENPQPGVVYLPPAEAKRLTVMS